MSISETLKQFSSANVKFRVADVYNKGLQFNILVGGFWCND